jgi:CHAT domain-containing protein
LAGARSTVTAAWAIPDEATAALMVDFHRHLTAGVDPAEALRRAQEAAIASADRAHPWYWAAFALHGATGEIDGPR